MESGRTGVRILVGPSVHSTYVINFLGGQVTIKPIRAENAVKHQPTQAYRLSMSTALQLNHVQRQVEVKKHDTRYQLLVKCNRMIVITREEVVTFKFVAEPVQQVGFYWAVWSLWTWFMGWVD